MKCPACSSSNKKDAGRIGVYICEDCNAVYGQCYLGESYQWALPRFHPDPNTVKEPRYYDLMCLGSEGIRRRHGWVDPISKLIIQVG